jgi:hypothetical protein
LPSIEANAIAKIKRAKFLPFQIGVLCTFFARVLDAPKGAQQACGILMMMKK